EPRLDLEYEEDVAADVDMNIVALESGRLVEVQGTGENASFTREELDRLLDLGMKGIQQLLAAQRSAIGEGWSVARSSPRGAATGSRRSGPYSAGRSVF